MNDEFVVWEPEAPGITFCLSSGRITIFLRTLALLEYPEFLRFLFNPRAGMFAVQTCSMYAEGARGMPTLKPEEGIEIKAKDLVRVVYFSRGWKDTVSYRAKGEFFPSEHLVSFNLHHAYEIHEGRIQIMT